MSWYRYVTSPRTQSQSQPDQFNQVQSNAPILSPEHHVSVSEASTSRPQYSPHSSEYSRHSQDLHPKLADSGLEPEKFTTVPLEKLESDDSTENDLSEKRPSDALPTTATPIAVAPDDGTDTATTMDYTKGSDSIVKHSITERDPNIVDWDGPDDPERPINWSTKKKWSNIAIISYITFLTPLASSMVAPGIPLVMAEFKNRNSTIASFIVSIYILGYAVGPLFLAPMSEVYGRLPVYHMANTLFVIFTIACALAPDIPALLIFRLLQGLAGSCPITIGGGSIADVMAQEKRGGAMSIFALGPLLGPVIGPVAGGYLAEDKGWRWVFWVIAIAAGFCLAISLYFMRETYEPVLLARKATKLRKETGNQDLRSRLDPGISKKDFFIRALVRPTKMLIFSPIVLSISVYMAIVYGYLYLLFTTLTPLFETQYHFSQGSVGLTYLGIGVGCLLGLGIFGAGSDRILKYLTKKHGGEMKPEYRLPPLMPGSLFIPIGLFWYGWSCEKNLHWIMPIIGTAWVGAGMIATFMGGQTYLIDAFTIYAASAVAANTVFRSLMGAFLPLAGPSLYSALGLGWGNSLLGFIALAFSPISFIFYKYGERIRKNPRFQVKL